MLQQLSNYQLASWRSSRARIRNLNPASRALLSNPWPTGRMQLARHPSSGRQLPQFPRVWDCMAAPPAVLTFWYCREPLLVSWKGEHVWGTGLSFLSAQEGRHACGFLLSLACCSSFFFGKGESRIVQQGDWKALPPFWVNQNAEVIGSDVMTSLPITSGVAQLGFT